MLKAADLTLLYPDFRAVYDLTVPRGALCALIGPSGGGKTTFLHAVAGFAEPHSGRLAFDGTDMLGLPPAKRPLSMLFQDHNLFPNLTAADNVGLGIDPALRLKPVDRDRVAGALQRVGLSGLGLRMPAEMSGGQKQRVALARALVRDRPLMLLDEPFSSLDPGLRREMIALVDGLRRERDMTVLLALHTPEDVRRTADLVAFIAEGRVAATGSPDALLSGGVDPRLDRYLGLGR